jgi:nucleoside-diphosphate-sugar epimerase
MTESFGRSKWIVVGGAGFIGSNLCRYLMDRKDRVICIDNMITGSWRNIQDLVSQGLVFFKHDACKDNPHWVWEMLDNVSGIFYLASLASPKFYLRYPIETIDTNTNGLRNWLNIAHAANCQLIYTSTSEIYGDPECDCQDESYNGNVDPQGVRSVYDESKRLGETICSVYRRNNWTRTKIVRIFNTYGPGMDPQDGRVLPNFINQALDDRALTVYGDGRQTRSFCFINDTIQALKRVADYGWDEELRLGTLPTINIGNWHDYLTVMQVAEKVRKAINPELEIITDKDALVEGDPKKRRPATALAQKHLAWIATTKFDAGLQQTIEYFKELRNVED